MRLDELGVLDDGAGVDDGGKRFCGEVSSASASSIGRRSSKLTDGGKTLTFVSAAA